MLNRKLKNQKAKEQVERAKAKLAANLKPIGEVIESKAKKKFHEESRKTPKKKAAQAPKSSGKFSRPTPTPYTKSERGKGKDKLWTGKEKSHSYPQPDSLDTYSRRSRSEDRPSH